MKSIKELEEIFQKMYVEQRGDLDGKENIDNTYTNPLAKMLFIIHHHHPESEKIIYYEEDVVVLLKRLGYPVWFK